MTEDTIPAGFDALDEAIGYPDEGQAVETAADEVVSDDYDDEEDDDE